MLRWREFHPYNAVHVAELAQPLDVSRLREVIAGHLTAQGLTGFALDAAGRRYEYRGGRAEPELTVLATAVDPNDALDAEMARQLNRPFPADGPFDPFRFFVVPTGSTFHLGIAYDHFVAGGDSIVVLLKGIVSRYAGIPPDAPPPEVHPRGYARLFLRNLLSFCLGLFALPAVIQRARHAVRPRYPYGDAGENAFLWLQLPATAAAAVAHAARDWGVTQNDLLVAMLMKAVEPEIQGRSSQQRRHEIAVASVFNIRREVAAGPDRDFGQFLSSFLVSHPMPPGVALRELASAVQIQTQRIKQRKLYLQMLSAIALGGLTWRFLRTHQRKQLYAKNFPVWAGISMLNVGKLWREAPGQAPLLQYRRAVSTGPFSPLVVSPTPMGERLQIGICYRTAAFRPGDVTRIGAALIACVESLPLSPP